MIRASRLTLGAVVLGATVLANVSVSDARIVQVSQSDTFHHSMAFLSNGESICKLTIVYYNNIDEFIGAHIVRVSATTGEVEEIARVVSEGEEPRIRRASTTSISPRVIDTSRYFYYLYMPNPSSRENFESFNLGAQLDLRGNCPPLS